MGTSRKLRAVKSSGLLQKTEGAESGAWVQRTKEDGVGWVGPDN